jgi:hypothetical protein
MNRNMYVRKSRGYTEYCESLLQFGTLPSAHISFILHEHETWRVILMEEYVLKMPKSNAISLLVITFDYYRLCGLVVRVLSYRSGGQGSIPGTTRKK